MQTDSNLQALVSLLESERPTSVTVMLEQIRSFPDGQLRRLGALAAPDSPAQPYIDLILAERQAPRVQAALLQWIAEGTPLEAGILLVSRSGFPRLRTDALRQQIDDLAEQLRPRLPIGGGVPRLHALIAAVTKELGFHGNVEDYYHPDNSYFNRVLELRTGLPISLTVLYMLLGERLGLKIAGIPLPARFIAAFPTSAQSVYFDPFEQGRILSLSDIKALVNQAGSALTPDMLVPASPRQIVERMFRNILHAHLQHDQVEHAELARGYLSVI